MKTKHKATLRKFQLTESIVSSCRLTALAGLFLLLAVGAQAAPQFFSGATANKNWDTSTLNWGSLTGGPYTAAWVNGNDAIFQGTAATVTNAGVSAHSLTFTVASYVVASNTLTLTGTLPAITNTVAATISSVIDGTAGFTKYGNAGLTLSGANTFTGRLTNNRGANVVGIIVANNDALGAGGAGNETVVVGNGNGGVGNAVGLNPGVTTPANETLILSALNGRAALVMQNGAGVATWGGNILATNTGSSGGAQIVVNNASSALNINGNISGINLSGGLLIRGGNGTNKINGNIFLTNTSVFKADTSIAYINSTGNKWGSFTVNQGTLFLGVNDALDTSAPLYINQAGGGNTPCVFDLNGFNQSVPVASNNVLTAVQTSTFRNSAAVPVVFTVNATNANSVLSKNGTGDILITGLISFVKNGTFTLSLGGANTYTGTNTINGGKLLIASATTALGNIANELDLNAGTIDLGGNSQSAGLVNVVSGVITNGTLTGTNFVIQAGTIGANLAGVGAGLTKTGNGTLVLSGANTYDQPTIVSGGKLVGATGGSLNSSSVTFAPGVGVSTTNGILITASGSQWTCAALTNTTAGGGNIYAEFNFGTVSGPSTVTAPLQVNGDADVNGTLNVIVKGGFGWIAGQTYPLAQISGAAPANIALNLVSQPAGVSGSTVSYDAVNKVINFTVGSAPQALTWIKGNGLWDVNTSTNWLNPSSVLSKFQQADSVTFDDTPGAGPFIVTNNTTVNPATVTIANNSADYTLTGSGTINSSSPFSKSSNAKLTVASANNFPGDSTVSAGTLVLASASALGSGGLMVNNATLVLGNASALGSGTLNLTGATLDSTVANLVNANNNAQTWNSDLEFAGSQNLNLGTGPVNMTASCQITTTNSTLTVGGGISGTAVTLTKAGAGALKLNGAGSYTGETFLNAGSLVVGANTALGNANNMLVVNGGTLDLNGFSITASNFNGTAGTVLNNSGSGLSILTTTNDSGAVSTFTGLITDNSTGAGTVGLAKLGKGTMIVTSSNSYSGPTTINSTTAGGNLGSLFAIMDPNAFGRTNGVTGEITELDDNNCVLLSNNLVVINKTINIRGTGGGASGGNGNGSLQSAAGQTNEWAGIVRSGASTSAGRFGVRQGATGLLIISGSIRDGLTATGAGLDVVANCDSVNSSVMFSAPAGVNTYSGQTIANRGILKLGAINTLPTTTLLNIGSAGSSSARFDLNGFDQTVGGLTHSGANTATLDNTSVTSTNTLTINQSTNLSYTGAIAGGTVLNLVKTGAGQLTLLGNNSSYAGVTTVSNGTLLVNSDLGTSAVVVNGGAFGGTGSLNGTVDVNSGCTLASGTNGIGTLTVNNTLTLAAGSTTSVEVDQTSATADLVTGLTTVTYGGTLVVTNLAGTLTTSDTFTLFSASTHVGNFSSIAGSPGAGLAWSFTNGVLSVVTAASYATYPTNLTVSVSGSTLTLAWPATHLGWILQAQTNALSVGLTTPTNTWFDMAGSSASNTNIININAANPTVFYRLRLP